MASNPTISESGNFITNPEGGREFGSDVGAPGLLNANVFSPFTGTVMGVEPSNTAWAPGRVLVAIDPSQGGGIFGIGHINADVTKGQHIQAGDLLGTIGDSSMGGRYGTAQGNAHIEAMFSQFGATQSGFLAPLQGSEQAKAALDKSIGIAALTRSGTISSDVQSITDTTHAGMTTGGTATPLNSSASTPGLFSPSDCGDSGGITNPGQTISYVMCQITNNLKFMLLVFGFIMLGIVLIGVGALSTKGGQGAAKTGAKLAIA